jgi:hypothetical protein
VFSHDASALEISSRKKVTQQHANLQTELPAGESGEILCRGDVHHNGGFVPVRIGIHPANQVVVDLIIDEQLELIAGFEPKARTDPDAVEGYRILGPIFQSFRQWSFRSCSRIHLEKVGPFGCQVQPDERKGLPRSGDHGEVLDARRDPN